MDTVKRPYELLVRWDAAGTLSGSQVQWRYVISENGVIVGENISSAEPVAVGSSSGFPLNDILDQVHADALAAAAAANTARDAATQRATAAEAGLAAMTADRDSETRRADAAEARLADLTATPSS